MKVIRDWFTESDNVTWCLARAMAAVAILSIIAAQVYALYQGKPFDPQAFGLGIGAGFAGVGVALGMKKETPA